ncbi:MAG: PASTA domain-containing protein, partial [Chloroflexota bacterium]
QQAIDQLLSAGAGLVRYDVDTGARGGACTVSRQEPAAGASFTRGSTATLWYVPGNNCTKKEDDD